MLRSVIVTTDPTISEPWLADVCRKVIAACGEPPLADVNDQSQVPLVLQTAVASTTGAAIQIVLDNAPPSAALKRMLAELGELLDDPDALPGSRIPILVTT